MPAYTTQSELVTRFGQEEILGLANDNGTIDAAVVTAAIGAAGATRNVSAFATPDSKAATEAAARSSPRISFLPMTCPKA